MQPDVCYICLSGETSSDSPLQHPCCSLRFHAACLARWCRTHPGVLRGTARPYMLCDVCSTPLYVTAFGPLLLQRRTRALYEVFPFVYLCGLCITLLCVFVCIISVLSTDIIPPTWRGSALSPLADIGVWRGSHRGELFFMTTCGVMMMLCSCVWIFLCALHRSRPSLTFTPSAVLPSHEPSAPAKGLSSVTLDEWTDVPLSVADAPLCSSE